MKRAWTRGEKLLWAAPLLFGMVALAAKFGPDVARRAMGYPTVLQLTPGTQLRSMALSANGDVLAAGGTIDGKGGWKRGSGTVHLWNARTLKPTASFAPVYQRDKYGLSGFDIYGLTLSPDASAIGFSRVGKSWALYDTKTQRVLWRAPADVSEGKFSEDGRILALSGSNIYIVDSRNGHVLTRWKRSGPTNSSALALSPDSTLAALIGPYQADDPIELYRVSDGKLIRRIERKFASSVAFSPDGKQLLVAASILSYKSGQFLDSFAPVRCYDVATGALKWEVKSTVFGGSDIRNGAFCDAVFSPDGRTVAAYQQIEGRVFLLESASGKIKKILQFGRAKTTQCFVPPGLAFSPDSERLFARGADAVLVWDLK